MMISSLCVQIQPGGLLFLSFYSLGSVLLNRFNITFLCQAVQAKQDLDIHKINQKRRFSVTVFQFLLTKTFRQGYDQGLR